MTTPEVVDESQGDDGPVSDEQPTAERGTNWRAIVVFAVLPIVVMVLALTAGFLKWQASSAQDSDVAAAQSLQAAKDSTVALLSYRPDTVERELTAARDRTTGEFRDSYTELTDQVVIPGAVQQQISTAVTIPAASSVSAEQNRAVALLFVNQTTTIGKDPPTASVSSVRVTMEKIDGRWLISGFDPV